MSLKIFLLFAVLIPGLANAQSIIVKKETSRVEGIIADGYEAVIESTQDEVEGSLSKFLKSVGKTKQSDNVITINGPLIGGKKYSRPIYSTTWQNGNTTSAWIGIHSNDWDDDSAVKKDLEKLLYDFSANFYREKIQVQIDESLRALQTVEKQQTRLVNQNKDLSNKIESNKREKIQLEKSLVMNKVELETLTKKLEENSKAQDSVAIAMEQIKKVVEIHRERQEKVN